MLSSVEHGVFNNLEAWVKIQKQQQPVHTIKKKPIKNVNTTAWLFEGFDKSECDIYFLYTKSTKSHNQNQLY